MTPLILVWIALFVAHVYLVVTPETEECGSLYGEDPNNVDCE